MGSRVARLIATWFGCGYARRAPGTVGSFVALFIALPLHHHAGFHRWHFLGMAAALFFPAVWAAGRVARDAKLTDPQIVVVDEVIGQWIAVAGPHDLDLFTGLAAFALFRLFDIWKPPPVRQLERLPGGWGIVADDVMAGCYAAILLLLAGRFNLY